MSNVQFSHARDESKATEALSVFANGRLMPPIDDTHPNFSTIKEYCFDSLDRALDSDEVDHLISLFDVAATVEQKFARLSDRVAVKHGVILLDGDEVHGTLQEQILAFLDAGEEFGPLVNFYEKLLTNPLGDVREGLYDWIAGQRKEGNFTITPEGDILGYKAVRESAPEWRTDEEVVYVPSRRGEGIVNDREVTPSEYIEQIPGDVVEMPRSRVLHEPSAVCGDGLHIGTYAYASTFMGDSGVVMLVKFSPRDIVSLPDRNSSWKLRVCRYTVVEIVNGPLDVPVYSPGQAQPAPVDVEEVYEGGEVDIDLTLDEDMFLNLTLLDLKVGDRVVDQDDDEGTITAATAQAATVKYDNVSYGEITFDQKDIDEGCSLKKIEPGRHPAQDDKGRFSQGRPGSRRDGSTGRFA